MPLPPIAGVHEIATMLGVSRQRVLQLMAAPGFPLGRRLKCGWVWAEADVVKWAEARRRG